LNFSPVKLCNSFCLLLIPCALPFGGCVVEVFGLSAWYPMSLASIACEAPRLTNEDIAILEMINLLTFFIMLTLLNMNCNFTVHKKSELENRIYNMFIQSK